ncbi:MAG: hypothetical protein ABIV05_06335 [Actinomycetota bacterium]
MTQTLTPPTTTSGPRAEVEGWLAAFEQALTGADVDAAVGVFATDRCWRDLVSFSSRPARPASTPRSTGCRRCTT